MKNRKRYFATQLGVSGWRPRCPFQEAQKKCKRIGVAETKEMKEMARKDDSRKREQLGKERARKGDRPLVSGSRPIEQHASPVVGVVVRLPLKLIQAWRRRSRRDAGRRRPEAAAVRQR